MHAQVRRLQRFWSAQCLLITGRACREWDGTLHVGMISHQRSVPLASGSERAQAQAQSLNLNQRNGGAQGRVWRFRRC
jgi:hypothetical protein